jgi:hypothetical protein
MQGLDYLSDMAGAFVAIGAGFTFVNLALAGRGCLYPRRRGWLRIRRTPPTPIADFKLAGKTARLLVAALGLGLILFGAMILKQCLNEIIRP